MATTHVQRDYGSAHRTLMCSEVWASNRNVAHSVELPGIQGWIYAAPLELGRDGGDMHYLSACDQRVLSRVVLADVSGHGQTVAAVAEQLLRLVRQHVNRVEQPALLSGLSASLQALTVTGDSAATYATALVAGFDSSSDTLVLTNAGHPPPLWYVASERRWTLLEQPQADRSTPVGLPIGLGVGSAYEDVIVQCAVGDVLICYTDGLSDSTDGAGADLGVHGLLELARGLPLESPMAIGATLLGLIDAFRHGVPARDDETLIVLQRAGS